MPENEKTVAPAYVSWKTFLNSIEQLSKGELPNVIDRTVLTGMAYSVQNQLFTGMRFLGLLDDKNKPTEFLEALVELDEEGRKLFLDGIFHDKYVALIDLNLKKTTPDELAKKVGEVYKVSGDTKEKAVRFFVSGAKYLGIEMSPLITARVSGVTRSAVRRTGSRKPADASAGISDQQNGSPGTAKTIHLQSGGKLTLTATLDLFKLNAEDRKFVFELIDRLEGYKQFDEPERGGS